ncbi:MAG: DEAD/DEAH box helicase family protein [bacterium]
MTLKTYQQRTLENLTAFLKQVAIIKNPRRTYEEHIKETYKKDVTYNAVGFTDVPYVCLRLPTGGGKTILAAYTVSLVCKEYLGRDFILVIWLVPNTTILDQTIKALQNRGHPYRIILDEAFAGNVSILSVEDALGLTRSTLAGSVTIIVTTLAAWRVDRTEGRKVYESNGTMKPHFDGVVKERLSDLEYHKPEDGGALKYSLANVVHLNRPLLIIDEAHNARTPLTFDTLQRLNPSCIIEYTATPKTQGDDRSNVLYNVSAAALKAEHVIKLPIELLTAGEWQQTISNAVNKQRELENRAQEEETSTGEYIRPIVLLQAEADREGQSTINVDEVKNCLINVCKVPEEEIAIATGDQREIDGVNLLERNCRIRFIITKQALKEGWDCPFAYVFCSVARVRSSKDVEQLLGRVLRMPKVTPKKFEELNRAYAFVYSKDFYEAANNLTDSLTRCGFEPDDAQRFLEIKNSQEELGKIFFGQLTRTLIVVPERDTLSRELRAKIEIDKKENTITLLHPISEVERDQLLDAMQLEEDKAVVEQMYRSVNHIPTTYTSPAKLGEKFAVPQLLIEFDGDMRPFDEEVLVPTSWNLARCNAELTEIEFPIMVEAGTKGLIDVDPYGKPFYHHASQIQMELTSLVVSSAMQRPGLVAWLVKETRHPSVLHTQQIIFVNLLIDCLMEKRKLEIEHLVYVRFRLKETVRKKVAEHFETAKKNGYQTLLLTDRVSEGKRKFSVGMDFVFPKDYPVNEQWRGRWKPKRHFYELVGDMNGEESECAYIIDSHSNVEFWIRNLDRQELHTFWLQTSTDKFYPDFIVKLKSGKILVVEYKSEVAFSNDDSKEKRFIGQFWEAESDGKCLFIMTKGKEWNLLRQRLCC